VFLCERTGCAIRHNKPSISLNRHVKHKFLLGRKGGGLPLAIYLKFMFDFKNRVCKKSCHKHEVDVSFFATTSHTYEYRHTT
jgi:hypothetical protein